MRPLLLLLAPLLFACGGKAEAEATDAATARQLRDLISACTPPAVTANSAIRHDWVSRRASLMEELSSAGPELGRAALAAFVDDKEAVLDVRRGLLEIAAKNAPEEAAPVLIELFSEYGEEAGLRTKACELLPLADPAATVGLIAAVLEDRYPGKSYPAEETMVRSYEAACVAAGEDFVPLLSIVAADLYEEQTGRLMAVRALGRAPGLRSRETLKTVLVESTGNAFLRRGAAQALISLAEIDPETESRLCQILEDVMNREADLNFQNFLVSTIEKHCR